jgi:hypothetical protein
MGSGNDVGLPRWADLASRDRWSSVASSGDLAVGAIVTEITASVRVPERREPDWDEMMAAAARLQRIVPDAVLVGGTADAQHAGHRVSYDDDHVVRDLKARFDSVLTDLEDTDTWVTARVTRPVQVLGSLDGVETGVRNLIRRRPLEVESYETPHGPIRVPSLAEMARIKAWLVLKRNATRDYLDLVALVERLGADAAKVLVGLDEWYADQIGPGGERVATQLARQLAAPKPYDLSDVDLRRYRRLEPRWQDWTAVADACRAMAVAMLDRVAEEEP